MTRADVIARLVNLEPQLRAHGVASLFLYGSYARDEAGPSSDIDILVDFGRGSGPSLSRFMDTYHALEEAFPGTEIGFGTRDSLVPLFRPHIENSAVPIF